MKHVLLLCALLLAAFLPVPEPARAASRQDDGLAKIMFNSTYQGMFVPNETGFTLCTNEASILVEEGTEENCSSGDMLFYDKKNGYMLQKVNGAPCGCGGEVAAAAYAKQDGSYLFLRNDAVLCGRGPTNGLRASEPFTQFLPANFSLEQLLPNDVVLPETSEAGFLLTADIPRKGTTTTFHLRTLPFGLYAPSSSWLWEYRVIQPEETEQIPFIAEESDSSFYWYSNELYSLLFDGDSLFISDAEKQQRERIRQSVLSGDITTVDEEDWQTFFREKGVSTQEKATALLLHWSKRIQFYYKVYQIEQQLPWDTFTMEWNPKEGRFHILKKWRSQEKTKSFLEFLQQEDRFWHMIC